MDYLYAQLDENNVCVGLSQLSGEVIRPNMIRLNENEFINGDLFGKQYVNGEWLTIDMPDESEG